MCVFSEKVLAFEKKNPTVAFPFNKKVFFEGFEENQKTFKKCLQMEIQVLL